MSRVQGLPVEVPVPVQWLLDQILVKTLTTVVIRVVVRTLSTGEQSSEMEAIQRHLQTCAILGMQLTIKTLISVWIQIPTQLQHVIAAT